MLCMFHYRTKISIIYLKWSLCMHIYIHNNHNLFYYDLFYYDFGNILILFNLQLIWFIVFYANIYWKLNIFLLSTCGKTIQEQFSFYYISDFIISFFMPNNSIISILYFKNTYFKTSKICHKRNVFFSIMLSNKIK